MSLHLLIQGGLGNQVSQYLVARYVARKLKLKVMLDTCLLNSRSRQIRGITLRKLSPLFSHVELYANCITPKSCRTRLQSRLQSIFGVSNVITDSVLQGILDPDQLVDIYKCKTSISIKAHGYSRVIFNKDFADDWSAVNRLLCVQTPSLKRALKACIHVRAGDYLHHPYFMTMGSDYYRSAIQRSISEAGVYCYEVFTDNLKHAQAILPELKGVKYNFNVDLSELNSFSLIARHHVVITANSTFSCVAAYLSQQFYGQQNTLILAPRYWVKDSCAGSKHSKAHFSPDSFQMV